MVQINQQCKQFYSNNINNKNSTTIALATTQLALQGLFLSDNTDNNGDNIDNSFFLHSTTLIQQLLRAKQHIARLKGIFVTKIYPLTKRLHTTTNVLLQPN